MVSAGGRADDQDMTDRVALAVLVLSLAGAGTAHAAEPIACPAKVGTLELANPNGTFPGTKGSLRGDPQTRAEYICSYGERRNDEAYITGQTYLVSVSWAGLNATAAEIASAKGCGVTRTGSTALESASATKRAWGEFNIAVEPHTAALRAAAQGLVAQAEALGLGCGSSQSPGPISGPPSPPSTPSPPMRRRVRWSVVGTHLEKGFYVVTRGSGFASVDSTNGTMTKERQAKGKIVLSFYRGAPPVKHDGFSTNHAPRELTARIRLSVHGPGQFLELSRSPEGDSVYSRLSLVTEIDDMRGTARMRRLCRADPFGTIEITGVNKPSDLGYVLMEGICGLAPFQAIGNTSGSSTRYLPLTSLQIA